MEPIEQEEISAFLGHFGMVDHLSCICAVPLEKPVNSSHLQESHSEHFTSWQHLMESKKEELKKMGVPVKVHDGCVEICH